MLSNRDPNRPKCSVLGCGKGAAKVRTNSDRTNVYRSFCDKHHRASMAGNLKLSKKDYCENHDARLGFHCSSHIVSNSQLQIDHIDGNRFNNDPSNIQTLCANCHAVKTKQNGDNLTRYQKITTTFLDHFEEVAATT